MAHCRPSYAIHTTYQTYTVQVNDLRGNLELEIDSERTVQIL